jgi:trimethylguanosine synthase
VHSITRPKTAEIICDAIEKILKTKDIVVTDVFSNIGGMCIALARRFATVNACELDPLHCKFLEHNLKAYEVHDKCKIYCGDSLKIVPRLFHDVVFLDPPWGGPEYKEQKMFRFPLLNGKTHIGEFMRNIMKTSSAKLLLLLCPPNLDLDDMEKELKIGFWTQIVDAKRKIFLLIVIR